MQLRSIWEDLFADQAKQALHEGSQIFTRIVREGMLSALSRPRLASLFATARAAASERIKADFFFVQAR